MENNSNHIQEIQYHEYLDEVIDEAERRVFETHIAGCQACRRELAELRQLFVAIESVPEANLQVDLSSNILHAIEKPAGLSRQWKLAIAVQLVVASILIVIAWPWLSSAFALYKIPTINTDIYPLITDLSTQLNMYITELSVSFNSLFVGMSTSSSQFLLGDVGVFIWPLAISATLLWFIGNGVLLSNIRSNNT